VAELLVAVREKSYNKTYQLIVPEICNGDSGGSFLTILASGIMKLDRAA